MARFDFFSLISSLVTFRFQKKSETGAIKCPILIGYLSNCLETFRIFFTKCRICAATDRGGATGVIRKNHLGKISCTWPGFAPPRFHFKEKMAYLPARQRRLARFQRVSKMGIFGGKVAIFSKRCSNFAIFVANYLTLFIIF